MATDFTTQIFNSKPAHLNAIQYVINLTSGAIDNSEPSISFTKVEGTVKSNIHFDSANLEEGVLNLFFIHFDDNDSVVYLMGKVHNLNILSGGNFLSGSETLYFDRKVFMRYLDPRAPQWHKSYVDKEPIPIIQSANTLVANLYKMIPLVD